MRYELTHDSIAKQIYDKASGEVLQRRKIERAIREAHLDFQERDAGLTRKHVDHFKSFFNQVNITDDEKKFVVDSGKKLHCARKRRILGYWVIATLFPIVIGWALFTFSYAVAQTAQREAIELVDQAKIALDAGNLIISLRLSQAAYDICLPKNWPQNGAWVVQRFFDSTFPELPPPEVLKVLDECIDRRFSSEGIFSTLWEQTRGMKPTPHKTYRWLHEKARIPHLTSEDSTTFRLK